MPAGTELVGLAFWVVALEVRGTIVEPRGALNGCAADDDVMEWASSCGGAGLAFED